MHSGRMHTARFGPFWGVCLPLPYEQTYIRHQLAWFPLGLENLEKWEGIFQSGNFEQTGQVKRKAREITQNTGKFWEFQTNIICYFLVIFK